MKESAPTPKFSPLARMEKSGVRFYSNEHVRNTEWGSHSPGPVYKLASDFVQVAQPRSPPVIKTLLPGTPDG